MNSEISPYFLIPSLVLAGLMPSAFSGASHPYEAWSHRVPIFVNSAAPNEISGQPHLLRGELEAFFLEERTRADFQDLRFAHYDPDTGVETPLEHYLEPDGTGERVTFHLRGQYPVRAGSGATDTLWIYGIHMRNNPAMYYRDGRVYMTYVARPTDRNVVDLVAYDADSRTFEGPVRIADLLRNPQEESNEHRAAAILADRDGYIHLVYGAHGGQNLLSYRRSLAPHDISAFTPEVTLTSDVTSSPNIFQLENGAIQVYVLARLPPEGARPITWDVSHYESVDGGQSWKPRRDVVRSEGWVAYFGSITTDTRGESIHMVWSWYAREGGVDFGHRDVLYARSDDGGRTWKRADGTVLGEEMSRTQSDLDYISVAENHRGFDVDVDSQGRPHVLWGELTGEQRLYHSMWDDDQWVTRELPYRGRAWWGQIRVHDDDSVHVKYRRNGNGIHSLRSHDFGAAWTESPTRSRGQHRYTVPSMARPSGQGPFSVFFGGNNSQDGYGPLFILPRTPEHAQAAIHMYYGNDEAVGESSPDLSPLREVSDDFRMGGEVLSRWNRADDGAVPSLETDARGLALGPNSPQAQPGGKLERKLPHPLRQAVIRTRIKVLDDHVDYPALVARDQSGREYHLLEATSEGTWAHRGGDGILAAFPEEARYRLGEWNDIEIHLDTATGLFRVSLDGTSVTTDDGLTLPSADGSPIASILIRDFAAESGSMPVEVVSIVIGSFATESGSVVVEGLQVEGAPFALDYALDFGFPEPNPHH